jgi:hypothetical protein
MGILEKYLATPSMPPAAAAGSATELASSPEPAVVTVGHDRDPLQDPPLMS